MSTHRDNDLESGPVPVEPPPSIDSVSDTARAPDNNMSGNSPRTEDSDEGARLASEAQKGWAGIASHLKAFNAQRSYHCNEDLDNLLVFAGLFSAILTAFNIETYKQLQPDPNAVTVLLLAQIAKQMNSSLAGNDIIGAFQPSSIPDSTSTRINALWFASLLFSLITAALCILVKQWLRQFAVVTASVQDSKEYCYRHWGLASYHVYHIADVLPMMLQVSLALFLVGFVYFAWSLNHTVAITATTIVALWFAIYLFTIVISIKDAVCPFRTAFFSDLSQLMRVVMFRISLSVLQEWIDISVLLHLFFSMGTNIWLAVHRNRMDYRVMQDILRDWKYLSDLAYRGASNPRKTVLAFADRFGLIQRLSPFQVTKTYGSQREQSMLLSALMTTPYHAPKLIAYLQPCLRYPDSAPSKASYSHIVEVITFTGKIQFELGLSMSSGLLNSLIQVVLDELGHVLQFDRAPAPDQWRQILDCLKHDLNKEHKLGHVLNAAFSQNDQFLDYDNVKAFLWNCFRFFTVDRLKECVKPTTSEALQNLFRCVSGVTEDKSPLEKVLLCPMTLFLLLHSEDGNHDLAVNANSTDVLPILNQFARSWAEVTIPNRKPEEWKHVVDSSLSLTDELLTVPNIDPTISASLHSLKDKIIVVRSRTPNRSL